LSTLTGLSQIKNLHATLTTEHCSLFTFDFRVSIVYHVLWLQSELYPP